MPAEIVVLLLAEPESVRQMLAVNQCRHAFQQTELAKRRFVADQIAGHLKFGSGLVRRQLAEVFDQRVIQPVHDRRQRFRNLRVDVGIEFQPLRFESLDSGGGQPAVVVCRTIVARPELGRRIGFVAGFRRRGFVPFSRGSFSAGSSGDSA